MTTEEFLYACTLIGLGVLVLAFLVISLRILIGPTLPDRVLGLDMLVAAGIGFIAIVAVKTRYVLYLDIAIALGLVGFLATVAFARFIIRRDRPAGDEPNAPLIGETVPSPQNPRTPPAPVRPRKKAGQA